MNIILTRWLLFKDEYVSERSGNIILASGIILNFAGKTHRDSRIPLFNIRVLYFMRASSETFAESHSVLCCPLLVSTRFSPPFPISDSLSSFRFPKLCASIRPLFSGKSRVPFNWWDAFRCARKWHGTRARVCFFCFFSVYPPHLPFTPPPFRQFQRLFLRRFSTVARIPATSVAFVTAGNHRRVDGDVTRLEYPSRCRRESRMYKRWKGRFDSALHRKVQKFAMKVSSPMKFPFATGSPVRFQ